MTKRQIMEKIPFKLLAFFLLLSAGIGVGGVVFYRHQRALALADIQGDLDVISQFKREEISAWRRERYGDAYVLTRSSQFPAFVRRWYQNPEDKNIRDYIFQRLDAFRIYDVYKDVILVDTAGKIKMYLGKEGAESLSRATLNIVLEAQKQNSILFSDFYYCDKCREVHLDLVAPLRDGETSAGAVILRINPHKFLYPLIQKWPVNSRTGETLLLRKEGNEILYLNELRHRTGTAMKLRFSLTDTLLPAVMAALGKEGMVEGRDYRGVAVAAVVNKIPDSPWYLVTKMDKEEIYQPLRRQGLRIFFMVAALIIITTLILTVIWQSNRRHFYKKLYQSELDKQALVRHFNYLTKYANDIIFLLDEERRIVDINERCLAAYGYSREELLGREAGLVRADREREKFRAQMEELKAKGALLYETWHRKKDGSEFPVEISARVIEIEGKKYLQGIVRDISERKQYEQMLGERNEELEATNQELIATEEELRHTNEKLESNYAELESANEELKAAEEELKSQVDELTSLHKQLEKEKKLIETLIDSAPNIVVGLGERSKILLFNRYAEKITGYCREEVLGQNWIDLFIPSEMREQMYRVWDEIVANRYIEHFYENPITCKGGNIKMISWSNTVLSENDEFEMVFSLGVDVTEKKKIEQRLAEASAQWSATFDAMTDGISILDSSQTILQANQAFRNLLGLADDEVIGRKCYELVHPEKRPHWDCPFAKMIESRRREEMELKMGDKIYNVLLEPIFDGQGVITGAVHMVSDITVRKKDEQKIKYQLLELQRWQKVMLDREDRVMELKQEVNDLLVRLGQPKKYNQ